MARTVFGPKDVEYMNDRVVLKAPFPELPLETPEVAPQEAESTEEYIGPTPEELRREAEKFKAAFAQEKAEMLEAARLQAEAIVEDARASAKQLAEDAHAAGEEKAQTAEEAAARRLEQAEGEARALGEKAATEAEAARALSYEEGLAKGREEGFAQGMSEVQRLVVRTQVILERLQDKRAEIINETEQQLVDLVLLIARKVVKSISASHKEVVIENIRAALAQTKTRGTVTVKVNLTDMELATGHIEAFTKMMEAPGSIQILEDSTIEAGGCVVETDFGEIDARIATQLAQLEEKIAEVSPLQPRKG